MSNKKIESWKVRTAKEKEIIVATKTKTIHPVVDSIVNQLLEIDCIQFIRVAKNDIQASNEIAIKGRAKIPISTPGHCTAIGVHLIIEESEKTIQFFEITSATKGYGERIVRATMTSIPDDWEAIVIMDYSFGFWKKMTNKYDKIMIL
jgi:hypothetical protein